MNSHRGWDPGALEVATFLSQQVDAPLYEMSVTRLLIEMNRSLDSDELLSEYSCGLPDVEKKSILQEFYLPYRSSIEDAIIRIDKPVLHLSIHSFTPVLNDVVREVDIGLLFDPARSNEVLICHRLKKSLEEQLPGLAIRFNEPYKGTDDGLTTFLRSRFDTDSYSGIEIEINQKFVNSDTFMTIQTELSKAISSLQG